MFKELFRSMLDQIMICKGFPVVAALIKGNKTLAIETNSKGKGKTDHKTHAEYKLLEWIKLNNVNGKLKLIIALPPCYSCMDDIKKTDFDIEITYLFDIWGKRNKNYLKEVKKSYSLKQNHLSDKSIDAMWNVLMDKYLTKPHGSSRRRLTKLHAGEIKRFSPK